MEKADNPNVLARNMTQNPFLIVLNQDCQVSVGYFKQNNIFELELTVMNQSQFFYSIK